MTVRSATKADVESMARFSSEVPLLRRYGWTVASARKILKRALKDPESDVVVAKDAGRIAGFAWVLRRGGFARSAYLRLIAVDRSLKRRGIGRLLMKEMEKRHLKPSGLILLATSTNKAARKFYETLGYRRVGILKDYVRQGLIEVIYFKPAPHNR